MSSVKASRFYNNEDVGRVFESVASMFGPPESGDLANYSLARERNQKADIVQRLAADPRYAGFDHQSIIADLYDPSGSFYAVDEGNATARRGQDITADTSRANNLQTNQFGLLGQRFGTPVGQGEMLPEMGPSVAGPMGMPVFPEVQGNAKPLSESEFKAGQLEELLNAGTLTPNDFARDFRSGVNVEEVVGPDGKPTFASRDAAIGMQPVPKTPLVSMGPNGEPLGNPGDGLVWQRKPDGTVAYDDRGAPIAIPYQGGKAFEEQRRRDEAAAAGETKDKLKSSVVLQNLDRALDSIEANPTFTTGLGAQATGWLGGSPARALESVLAPISANIGFDQLQAMRDASPTGGALGQVTERELAFLQSVLGNIDLEAGPQVIDDIKRLKNIYLDTVHGAGNGPPRERLSFPSQWDQFANNAEGAAEPEAFAVNPQTGERLVFRNGQWVPVEASR